MYPSDGSEPPDEPNQNAAPWTNPSNGTKPASTSPSQFRRHASSVARYAPGSPVTTAAITCHEKPTTTRQQAQRDDVDDLAGRQRLAAAREPPPDAEQAEEQREREHAGPGEAPSAG